MIKKNKKKILLSSAIILLPTIIGLILWNKLPDIMPTHWNSTGTVDGWSNKFIAVFTMPLILLVVHLICIFFTSVDPKNNEQNKKVFDIIFWICPLTCLISETVMYAAALEVEFNMDIVMILLLGLMFIIIGNYLPKCKQNYTIGIKIPWTLNNEKNWNKTHRFAGKIWVIGGILLIICIFSPIDFTPYILTIIILAIALIPMIYSYIYHRKQLKEGTAYSPSSYSLINKENSLVIKFALIFTGIIFIGVAILLFTGNIELKYDDTSFTIEADYWQDLTVEYADINNIEYRETDTPGSRTNGFGSPRLLMGSFKNNEFDYYTRYTYTKSTSCVVLEINDRILVIGGKDNDSTMAIYDNINRKL